MSLCNKQIIIKLFLTSIPILLCPCEKTHSESGEKYAQILHRLQVKTIRNSSEQACCWTLMSEDVRRWTFSPEEELLWIMGSFFRPEAMLYMLYIYIYIKHLNDIYISYKHTHRFSPYWISSGLLWCFYQLFELSFWWHPFTAEDPLVNKKCNAKFIQIINKPDGLSSIFIYL